MYRINQNRLLISEFQTIQMKKYPFCVISGKNIHSLLTTLYGKDLLMSLGARKVLPGTTTTTKKTLNT